MSDFLLELRSEEIPARMQAGARGELEKLVRKALDAAGVSLGEVVVWSTPRRLALIARDLPAATEPVRDEVKGPKVGAPPQALEGFLRKTGLTQDQLEDRGGTYFAVSEKPGRATREVLAEAIPAIVRQFAWPKSMRWGAASLASESLRWVRPLSGIVAILGEELVECEVGGIVSSYATLGHSFHCPGPITIGGAHDYREKLRACRVIVDHEERQALIRERAAEAAAQAGLTLVADEGLVIENAGLTEWPVPLLGRFDAAFLEVPPEVIQLTARTNQKYFVCRSSPDRGGGSRAVADGGDSPPDATSRNPDSPLHQPEAGPPPRAGEELANAFVCTANIEAADGGAAIVDGNRKVLAARLADARFFWEQDRRKSLEDHAKRLENIVFHEKLGTVADKVERVAKLARWLVEEGIVSSSPGRGGGSRAAADGGDSPPDATPRNSASPLHRPADGPPPRAGEELADLAEQAARLSKADLVTEMVGEFPELQGVMGGYYARAEGLPAEVADAIRDHYKPVGQGDDVPTAPVTVAVSLADKLDTLYNFFVIGEAPTGSKDPFALRRQGLALIALTLRNNLQVSVEALVQAATQFRFNQSMDAAVEGRPRLEQYVLDVWKGKRGESDWLEEFGRLEADLSFPLKLDFDVEGIGQVSEAMKVLNRTTETIEKISQFLNDRLKVQQREAGVRHDLIDAVFALGGEDDLVRLLARVRALQAFVGTADGANLLAGYKRAANILKKEGYQSGAENILSYTPENQERALIEALDAAEPRARDSVAAEDFAAAMGALASLRGPIDAFFDHVTVNDEDPAKRAARLALLDRFRSAVHQVADFSKIEG